MENQNNNLQELEELRSQVAAFKNRVEQQEIVSRRLLREAMKGHVFWIKQMSIWGSVGELVILPLLVYALRSIVGVSWLPIIAVGLVIVGVAFAYLRSEEHRRFFMATYNCHRSNDSW